MTIGVKVLADGVPGIIHGFCTINFGVVAIVEIGGNLSTWELKRLKVMKGENDDGQSNGDSTGPSSVGPSGPAGAGSSDARTNGRIGTGARPAKV